MLFANLCDALAGITSLTEQLQMEIGCVTNLRIRGQALVICFHASDNWMLR